MKYFKHYIFILKKKDLKVLVNLKRDMKKEILGIAGVSSNDI